ncbi:ADP-ribosylation factor-like protein 13B isoform X1 [Arapaima gigas]
MSSCSEWLRWWRGPPRKVTLVMVGLDNAGKTTAVKGIRGENPKNVLPAVGFSKVDMKQDKFEVTILDLGGDKMIRGIWKKYYPESHGVVFVVDSSDVRRIQETKATMTEVLQHPWIAGKPVLVLANKQDQEGALAVGEIIEHLSLEKLVNKNQCPCQIEPCSAVMTCGKKLDGPIENGLTWLLRSISEDYEAIRERVRRDTEKQRACEVQETPEQEGFVRWTREDRGKRKSEEAVREGGLPQEDDVDEGHWAAPFKPVSGVIVEAVLQNENKLKHHLSGQESDARMLRSPTEGGSEGVLHRYREMLLQQLQHGEEEQEEEDGASKTRCPDSSDSGNQSKKKKILSLKRKNRVDPLRPDTEGEVRPALQAAS